MRHLYVNLLKDVHFFTYHKRCSTKSAEISLSLSKMTHISYTVNETSSAICSSPPLSSTIAQPVIRQFGHSTCETFTSSLFLFTCYQQWYQNALIVSLSPCLVLLLVLLFWNYIHSLWLSFSFAMWSYFVLFKRPALSTLPVTSNYSRHLKYLLTMFRSCVTSSWEQSSGNVQNRAHDVWASGLRTPLIAD